MKKTRKVLALVLVLSMVLSIGALAVTNSSDRTKAQMLSETFSNGNIDWISDQNLFKNVFRVNEAFFSTDKRAPSVSFDYEIFSFNELDETNDPLEAAMELTFDVAGHTFSVHTSGQVYLNVLTDEISLLEGVLEGQMVIGEETFDVVAGFQKRVGYTGVGASITVTPADADGEPLFLHAGVVVYTPEVKAVHPIFIELSEKAEANEQREAGAAASSAPTRAQNLTGFSEVGGTGSTSNIVSNSFGLSGMAQEMHAYFKPEGVAGRNGRAEYLNIALIRINTKLERLNEQGLNHFPVSLVRFRGLELDLNSDDPDGRIDSFYELPEQSAYNGTLWDLFEITLSFISGSGLIEALLEDYSPNLYNATVSVDEQEATFETKVYDPYGELDLDDDYLPITYVIDFGSAGSFDFTASSRVEYMIMTEQGNFYLKTAWNTLDFSLSA